MPFHRFEGMESYRFNPHLSSTTGPVLEGEYMYFRRVTKKAGSGAKMHYHPNELMAFLLAVSRRRESARKTRAITGGLGRCYYPMLESLDAPRASAHFERWVEGTHIAFGFVESPEGHAVSVESAPHEMFLYVLSGALAAQSGAETREMAAGDVMHVPRGTAYGWTVADKEGVRYAAVRSLPRLEAAIAEHGAADNWRG